MSRRRHKSVSGVVLCGGRSVRMGRPKAWLPWRGRPMLEHVVSSMRGIVDEVLVVGSPGAALPDVGARVVDDRVPDLGPLGGIREGLHAVDAELALITGTDAPFLSRAFVDFMLGLDGTAACEVEGHVQPLPALYESRFATAVDRLIERGKRRPIDLLEAANFRKVAETEVDRRVFAGFNTPAEYLRLLGNDPGGGVHFELEGRAREIAGRSTLVATHGLLRDVLLSAGLAAILDEGGSIGGDVTVALPGVERVANTLIPVGPGDRVHVCDRGP